MRTATTTIGIRRDATGSAAEDGGEIVARNSFDVCWPQVRSRSLSNANGDHTGSRDGLTVTGNGNIHGVRKSTGAIFSPANQNPLYLPGQHIRVYDMFGSSRSQLDDIALGQQFRAIGGGIWEYVGKAPTKVPEPHVCLVRPEDRLTIKIISLDALIDRSLFEPVG